MFDGGNLFSFFYNYTAKGLKNVLMRLHILTIHLKKYPFNNRFAYVQITRDGYLLREIKSWFCTSKFFLHVILYCCNITYFRRLYLQYRPVGFQELSRSSLCRYCSQNYTAYNTQNLLNKLKLKTRFKVNCIFKGIFVCVLKTLLAIKEVNSIGLNESKIIFLRYRIYYLLHYKKKK